MFLAIEASSFFGKSLETPFVSLYKHNTLGCILSAKLLTPLPRARAPAALGHGGEKTKASGIQHLLRKRLIPSVFVCSDHVFARLRRAPMSCRLRIMVEAHVSPTTRNL